MTLTGQQKRFLRGQAHALRPVITVGDKGITPALLSELDASLEHHELIKIKIRGADRAGRDATIASLARDCGAELVSRVGNVAALYRAARDKPRIVLPRA
jgi:RNA-binding protein